MIGKVEKYNQNYCTWIF